MGGTSRRNFSLFQKLCGEHGMQNVIIVTTWWEGLPLDVGLKGEEQLRSQDNLFHLALESSATLLHHDNAIKSAYDILEQLVHHKAEPLKIQMELVDERKDILETAAGIELHRLLQEQAYQQIATLTFDTIGHYSTLLATIRDFCDFSNFGDQKVDALGHPMLLGHSSHISRAMIVAKYR